MQYWHPTRRDVLGANRLCTRRSAFIWTKGKTRLRRVSVQGVSSQQQLLNVYSFYFDLTFFETGEESCAEKSRWYKRFGSEFKQLNFYKLDFYQLKFINSLTDWTKSHTKHLMHMNRFNNMFINVWLHKTIVPVSALKFNKSLATSHPIIAACIH